MNSVLPSFVDFSWPIFFSFWFFAGATASPLLAADSGMNTMIEGGRDKKLTAKLQKVQGMAMGESTSESTLRDCFDSTRSIAERLRLGPTTKVRFFRTSSNTQCNTQCTTVVADISSSLPSTRITFVLLYHDGLS